MEYKTLNIKYVIVQLLRKGIRRTYRLFFENKTRKKTNLFLMECIGNVEKCHSIQTSFATKICFNPPPEVYMFFPIGKGPVLSESYVFLVYKGSKIAGWAWLHQGDRKDITKAHGLKINDNVLWFGPDYVRPKFRGNSLQRILIKARLEYIKKYLPTQQLPIKSRKLTLIEENNVASLNSYTYFNFVKVKKIVTV